MKEDIEDKVDEVSEKSNVANIFEFVDGLFDTVDEAIKVYETVKGNYKDFKVNIQQPAIESNVEDAEVIEDLNEDEEIEEELEEIDTECIECGEQITIFEGDHMGTCECGNEIDRSDV